MKKLTSIFLILLLSLSSVGTLLFYYIKVQICKQQAALLIDRNVNWSSQSIVEFSTKEKNFTLVGNDEIRSNGNMYDILKIKIENGVTIYYTLADGKEDKLIDDIAAFAKDNSTAGNTSSKKNAFEITKFVNDATDYSNESNFQLNKPKYFSINIFSYHSPFYGVRTPPPRFI